MLRSESLNVCIDIIWNWLDWARVGLAREVESVSFPEINLMNQGGPHVHVFVRVQPVLPR